jgi:NhaP-type Na+/H+ or K+/H+ antiporter
MVSVVSLLLVLALSMLVIRVGAVAFLMTGLSEEVARFQSLSAFSGTGFTTDEAETVVKDPARRRIATLLIRLGAIGVVSSIATLLLSFVGAGGLRRSACRCWDWGCLPSSLWLDAAPSTECSRHSSSVYSPATPRSS